MRELFHKTQAPHLAAYEPEASEAEKFTNKKCTDASIDEVVGKET